MMQTDSDDIRSLSYAEHFIVWVMRSSVACAPECRMIHREFRHAFGPLVEAGAQAFEGVLLALAKSTRRITLSRPGHIRMSHDELSLVALFAAAQAGDEARLVAHARWLMGGERTAELIAAAGDLSRLLAYNGHAFRRVLPDVQPCAQRDIIRLHAVNGSIF